MWKEKFRIGVDLIDSQHKELFAKTKELLDEVHNNGVEHKDKCIETILFLKNYAVRHFQEEETYQISIGYKGYEAHKKLHEKFIQTVLSHEKKMVASDFAEKDVKEFSGMLVAWLLYHVTDVDQKIGKEFEKDQTTHSHSEIVFSSLSNVLCKVVGLEANDIKEVKTHNETFNDAYVVEVELTGDASGYIVLVYPKAVVKSMILSMMNYTPDVIDELEISALFETSSIISGTICNQISKEKGINCDISMPFTTQRTSVHPEERIAFETGIGIIEADITIEYK